jgi:hypothetical protein
MSSPAAVAAVVLGCVLGVLLLAIAAGVAAWAVQRRRQRRQLQHAAWRVPDHSTHYDTALLAQQQVGGSTHGPAGGQMMHHASPHLRQGSYEQQQQQQLLRSGHGLSSDWPCPHAAAQLLVHLSPNSATTNGGLPDAASLFAVQPSGPSGRYDTAQQQQQQQQQQQHGLDHVERSRASLLAATAVAAQQQQQQQPDAVADGGDAAVQGDVSVRGGTANAPGHHKQQMFEAARKQLGGTAGDLAGRDALVLESVLGEGTFGKVFKGVRVGPVVVCLSGLVPPHLSATASTSRSLCHTPITLSNTGWWKGTRVAVKTMIFAAAMSGREKREKMAIMETAISSALSHPNIIQVSRGRRSTAPVCDVGSGA